MQNSCVKNSGINFPVMRMGLGVVDLRGAAGAKVARVVVDGNSVVVDVSVKLSGGMMVRFEGDFVVGM